MRVTQSGRSESSGRDLRPGVADNVGIENSPTGPIMQERDSGWWEVLREPDCDPGWMRCGLAGKAGAITGYILLHILMDFRVYVNQP